MIVIAVLKRALRKVRESLRSRKTRAREGFRARARSVLFRVKFKSGLFLSFCQNSPTFRLPPVQQSIIVTSIPSSNCFDYRTYLHHRTVDQVSTYNCERLKKILDDRLDSSSRRYYHVSVDSSL
jgi:hypothetical protein